MEALKKQTTCERCDEPVTIDFETADFSVQISRINGKTEEQRIYFIQCPNCKRITTTDSANKAEWGNRKGPNPKRLFFRLGAGFILFLAVAAVVLYFAGQGLITIFDWLTN